MKTPMKTPNCQEREARSECLEIVEVLQRGLDNGTLTNNGAQMLLMVLHVHLEALGFKKYGIPLAQQFKGDEHEQVFLQAGSP